MAILAKSYKEDGPIINGIPNEYPIGSGLMKTEIIAVYLDVDYAVQEGDPIYVYINNRTDYLAQKSDPEDGMIKPNAIALQSGRFGSIIKVVPLEIIT